MKEAVGRDMASTSGNIRFLIATEAYSMGTDAPDIRRVIHIGPPGSLESKSVVLEIDETHSLIGMF